MFIIESKQQRMMEKVNPNRDKKDKVDKKYKSMTKPIMICDETRTRSSKVAIISDEHIVYEADAMPE